LPRPPDTNHIEAGAEPLQFKRLEEISDAQVREIARGLARFQNIEVDGPGVIRPSWFDIGQKIYSITSTALAILSGLLPKPLQAGPDSGRSDRTGRILRDTQRAAMNGTGLIGEVVFVVGIHRRHASERVFQKPTRLALHC
jgi:hypothetical protein